ncbi:MAG: cytochrome d ubiquinol oxidase subunit II [Candidatus Sumerlaeia bacterium]
MDFLQSTWFILWGLLWAIYFMLDGFDLGIGVLLPVLGRTEDDRNALYRSLGPYWDGNEVWLIAAGGVTFAAFPTAYAVMFSALYTPLMLILFALIFRGAAIGFRSEVDHPLLKLGCDAMFFLSSLAASILLGVTFANLFMGIAIDAEGVYQGTLLSLLNPYGLAGGLFFLLFFMVHGAAWIKVKTHGSLARLAARTAGVLWPVLAILAIGFLVLTAIYTDLYANYLSNILLMIIPLGAVACLVFSFFNMWIGKWLNAWLASCGAIFLCVMFGVIGMYPAMLISNIDPAYNVTIDKAASTPLTLKIMLGVALVLVPVIIAYQTWMFFIFKGKSSGPNAIGEDVY